MVYACHQAESVEVTMPSCCAACFMYCPHACRYACMLSCSLACMAVLEHMGMQACTSCGATCCWHAHCMIRLCRCKVQMQRQTQQQAEGCDSCSGSLHGAECMIQITNYTDMLTTPVLAHKYADHIHLTATYLTPEQTALLPDKQQAALSAASTPTWRLHIVKFPFP